MSWASLELLIGAVSSATQQRLFMLTDNPLEHQIFMSEALKILGTSLQSQRPSTLRDPRRHKHNEQSLSLREQGNQYFAWSHDLKNLEQALELYTKSIAYATPGSIELAFGYANRAVALLKLNRPMEALEDLERAFENHYPKESQTKLWSRRGEAYAKLAEYNYIAAKHWLDETPMRDRSIMEGILKNYSASEYKDTIDVVREVPTLESPNEKYPFCSDAIEIQYTGKFGKKVVATRDIDVMETLILDAAYSLNPLTDYFYTHCSHCLNSFWNGIPCNECIHVLYCSETCKKAAWAEYHCFECSVSDIALQYEGNNALQGARITRLLLQMYHEAGGAQKLKERVRGFYEDKNGDEIKDKWYREHSLETVLMVDTNLNRMPTERMGFAAVIALCALYYLGTTTDFFGIRYETNRHSSRNIVAMSQHPDVKFIGALLLKLGVILCTNALTWNEVVLGDVTKYQRGFLFLPFTGTLKSNCHSNVVAQCLEYNYVVHAMRPIKKGEELVLPFGKNWLHDEKSERMSYLMASRSITCDCVACANDWPMLEYQKTYQTMSMSAKSKGKLSRIFGRFQSLKTCIYKGDIPEPERTHEELKRLFKTFYEEVDFPCKELSQIFRSIAVFYQMTSKLSKLKKLHTIPAYDYQ